MSGGGAAGVTVFFVLSGFLITAMLLEEHERHGRISLSRFFERRARRLVPALVVSLAGIAALAPALGPGWFRWDVLPPVLLYYSNWTSPAHLSVAVMHTWSLAVEEQFYLLWPLVLLAVVRKGRRSVSLVACFGVAISLTIRLQLITHGASLPRIYSGTDSVAFGPLAGAALAAWLGFRPERRGSKAWVISGVALLLPTLSWPFEVAVVFGPVIDSAAGILFLAAAVRSVPPRLMTFSVLTWFGRRAYGLYLLHAPLNAVLEHELGLPWGVRLAVLFPVSAALAELSHRWIERPFRRAPDLGPVPTTQPDAEGAQAVIHRETHRLRFKLTHGAKVEPQSPRQPNLERQVGEGHEPDAGGRAGPVTA